MRQIGLLAGTLALLITSGVAAQNAPANANRLQERLRAPAPSSVQAVPQLTSDEKARLNEAKPAAPAAAIRGQSVALMIAGGVLFVTGAVVGGDAGTILMVGGAVVGAYGVYLHFR
jgi:hypothetical protein